MFNLPHRHRRAGYFYRERYSVQGGEMRFQGDMLIELTHAELRDVERAVGPSLTLYRRVDAATAHRHVKRGYTHATGLWIDDGRIRYSGPDPMTLD